MKRTFKFIFLVCVLFLQLLVYSERKCWNCGKINYHDNRYCSECSTDISNVKQTSSKKITSIKTTPEKNEEKTIKNYSKSFNIAMPIFLGLFILIILSKIIQKIQANKKKKRWEESKKEFNEHKKEKEKEMNKSVEKAKELMRSYKILNLKQNASKDELIKQYKILTEEYHPDQSNQIDSEKLKKINWAYNYLKNRLV